MIRTLFNRLLPGIWSRLLIAILLMVVMVWLVLATAIYFFNTTRQDFEDIAANQIPRLALASELMLKSARLAQLTSTIVSDQKRVASDEIRTDLTAVVNELSGLIHSPVLALDTATPDKQLPEDIATLLKQILGLNVALKQLDEKLFQQRRELHWLNVDIQDEVDPLLNDFAFNVKVAMSSLTQSLDLAYREKMALQIEQESTKRNALEQVGSEASTLLTLMLQGSITTDSGQLEQLLDLSDDALARLSDSIQQLPNSVEYLTLQQSVKTLLALQQDKASVFPLSKSWITLHSSLLESLNAVQLKLGLLQSTLANLSKIQRTQVQQLTIDSVRQTRTAIGGLLGLTLLVALLAILILFGYIRRGIVKPLEDMTVALLAISEGKRMPRPQIWGQDEIGRMVHAVEVFQDSVEARDRTLTELRQTQVELVQAGKLAALGQLSAGISHELNQPLTAMKYRMRLLEKGLEAADESKSRHQLQKLQELVERMESTIVHLKRYARRADFDSEPLRLDQLIHSALHLFAVRLREAAVEVELGAELTGVIVIGDSILIEQVIINLLSNALDAIQASGEAGKISIGGRRQGKQFELLIRDTGVGLGALSAEAAFDPFVTTKEVGAGLGLGLSISHSIARDMGGDLRLEPCVPRGVQAVLILPRGDNEHDG